MGLFSKIADAQQQAQSAMAGAGGMASVPGMGGDMSAQAAYAQTANRLGQVGREAPGVIHSIAPTGKQEFGGGQQVAFEVTLRPEGGEPVSTTITQSMLPAQMESIAAGQSITVRYDPESPTTALIYGW